MSLYLTDEGEAPAQTAETSAKQLEVDATSALNDAERDQRKVLLQKIYRGLPWCGPARPPHSLHRVSYRSQSRQIPLICLETVKLLLLTIPAAPTLATQTRIR